MTYEEYLTRAQAFMPKTPQHVEVAARQLAAQGFWEHTVAAILRVDVTSIRLMLVDPAGNLR